MMTVALGWVLMAHASPSVFRCCDAPVVERVVDRWFEVGAALAEGRPHASASQALARAAKLPAPEGSEQALQSIAEQADVLASLPTSSAREEVFSLARDVVWLALRHESGALSVVQVTCPGQGSWLQRSATPILNPSGSTCGTAR